MAGFKKVHSQAGKPLFERGSLSNKSHFQGVVVEFTVKFFDQNADSRAFGRIRCLTISRGPSGSTDKQMLAAPAPYVIK